MSFSETEPMKFTKEEWIEIARVVMWLALVILLILNIYARTEFTRYKEMAVEIGQE